MPRATWLAVIAACILATAGVGCGARGPCEDIALSAEAASSLAELDAASSFPIARPCAYEAEFEVGRVFADALPEQGRQHPRVNFSVHREGERAFVLSQTEATVPFLAIPLGSHRLQVEVDGRHAEGFAGPSGAGVDIAYLRWRRDGVTFELAATLRPWLTERDMQDLAAGMMER
ncbi:MAG: hypothetical protein OXH97_04285 [Chloroflexota bacterium]|nr:hypothetical protein [Chloroflexota bacterium]